MDNYKSIERKLANGEAFNGNTMSASWSYGVYTVWSYNEPIAEATRTFFGVSPKWITPDKFSVTTSKHTNLVRRVWGI